MSIKKRGIEMKYHIVKKIRKEKCKFKGHDRISAIGLSNHRMGVYSMEKYCKSNCNQQFILMMKYFTLSWWTGGWRTFPTAGEIFNVVCLIQWILKGKYRFPLRQSINSHVWHYVQPKLSSRSVSNFSSLRAAAYLFNLTFIIS